MEKQGTIKETAAIMLMLAFALLLAGAVSGLEGFCFASLHNGESTSDGFYTCLHTTCQVCIDASTRAYASWNKCEEACAAVPGQEPNLTLQANFPFPDFGIYTKQAFMLDIHTNKIASIYLIDNVAETQKTLCPNCKDYTRSTTFKQGFNDITIRAVDGGEVKEMRIRFTVDNKKPVISSTLPASNKFAASLFSVYYDEDNVEKVKLSYGNTALGMREINLTGCPSGKKQTCSADVDLGDYDGGEINYFFTIKDIAGNIVVSKTTKVKVDETLPVITSLTQSISRRSVAFNINITEKNFNKVEYADNSGDSKWKVMCSSLSKGACKKVLNFLPGVHNIDIRVSDKAGNFIVRSIPEFEIL